LSFMSEPASERTLNCQAWSRRGLLGGVLEQNHVIRPFLGLTVLGDVVASDDTNGPIQLWADGVIMFTFRNAQPSSRTVLLLNDDRRLPPPQVHALEHALEADRSSAVGAREPRRQRDPLFRAKQHRMPRAARLNVIKLHAGDLGSVAREI